MPRLTVGMLEDANCGFKPVDIEIRGAMYSRMGNAISPRGDMLKYRVLTRSKKRGTHHVVDKFNLN